MPHCKKRFLSPCCCTASRICTDALSASSCAPFPACSTAALPACSAALPARSAASFLTCSIFFGLLFLCKLLILLGLGCWIYPLLSRYEQGILNCFSWALHLLLRHFPRTLFCILLTLASAFLIWLEPLFVCILPSTTALLASFFIEPVLRTICGKEEDSDPEKDAWYLEK